MHAVTLWYIELQNVVTLYVRRLSCIFRDWEAQWRI